MFDSLIIDPLTRVVVTHAINISLDLEDILTGLRRHGLQRAVAERKSLLLDRYRTFFAALAIQAERTDFAWIETEEETEWLHRIKDAIDSQLMLSAYRRPDKDDQLHIPALSPINDSISLKVRDQYVAYPYPRWERLMSTQVRTLHDLLCDRFPHDMWPERFKGPVAGLSAGCGTGRGALLLARTIEKLDLTAVDLSPASVAFALSKADSLGIEGVTFGLADILELRVLDRRFDIIESSGVLHHMDDPAAGLKVLTDCLSPDGVMRLALYSERGRAAVTAARAWIAEEGIEDSEAGLRDARVKLRALPPDHPARAVVDTPEFFVLSGLHDLVFHVQEHRFTPLQLKALLDNAGLRLLGFDHADPSSVTRYAESFPDDLDQTNLDNWGAFEQNHPDTFAEMYQMWCRPA